MKGLFVLLVGVVGAVGAVGATGCPDPAANDCTAKATCTPADAAIDAGFAAWDASLDAGGPDASLDAGGDSDDGSGGPTADSPVPVEEPTPCPVGTSHACVPAIPAGFAGPITFWQGAPGAAPACPTGYPRARDTYWTLDAGEATCACSCEAMGQSCVSQVTVYPDSRCMTTPCATSVQVDSCGSFSGCTNSQGSLRTTALVVQGGTCMSQMTEVTVPHASWTNATRMCDSPAPADDSEFFCAEAGTICAQVPEQPYQPTLCVAWMSEAGAPQPTSCPTGYPNGPMTSYDSFSDNRNCASCTCGAGPVGGSCVGSLSVTSVDEGDCTTAGMSFTFDTLGTGCQPFGLSDSIGNMGVTSTLTPGSCSIVTEAMPTGSAAPAGSPQVLCCQSSM